MTPVAAPAAPPPPAWVRAEAAGLAFRPMIGSDLPFLRQVYAATRAEELAVVPWSEADKAAFVAMQFDAQHRHYQQHYPDADWLIAACGGEDIGRLYLDRNADRHRIIDIAILPSARGRGLGTAILRDLLDAAAAAGRAVEIHVEQLNPARRLYERLGFTRLEERGPYELMRWTPDQENTAS